MSKYTIIIEEGEGNYINATTFYLLPENNQKKKEDIITWSFDHLKNNFIYNYLNKKTEDEQ
jgi:hypothetical protein